MNINYTCWIEVNLKLCFLAHSQIFLTDLGSLIEQITDSLKLDHEFVKNLTNNGQTIIMIS